MTIECHAAMVARQRLEPFRYDAGALSPEAVEVAIQHCGICHSDIHLIDNDWGISTYPLVPGHEIVGTVTAGGSIGEIRLHLGPHGLRVDKQAGEKRREGEKEGRDGSLRS
jgi:uncharacterized zinc-type alcohol dehydrogenase-like protein